MTPEEQDMEEEKRQLHPWCPTCCCSQWWEIVSHHLVKAAEIALGIVVAGLVLSWFRVNL